MNGVKVILKNRVTAPTVSGLGDACNWEYARLDQPPPLSIVELALLAQREQIN